MSKAVRQGDVLIVPCREIPGTAKEVAPENGQRRGIDVRDDREGI